MFETFEIFEIKENMGMLKNVKDYKGVRSALVSIEFWTFSSSSLFPRKYYMSATLASKNG